MVGREGGKGGGGGEYVYVGDREGGGGRGGGEGGGYRREGGKERVVLACRQLEGLAEQLGEERERREALESEVEELRSQLNTTKRQLDSLKVSHILV